MAFSRITSGSVSADPSASTIPTSSFAVSQDDLIVLGVRDTGSTARYVTSLSDGIGTRYQRAGSGIHLATGGLELWWGIAPSTAGTNAATAAFNLASTFRVITWGVYRNTGVPILFDKEFSGQGTGATVTSNTFTTQVATSLIVAVAQVSTGPTSWTPNSGYTEVLESTNGVCQLQELIASSIQSGVTVGATNTDTGTQKILCGAVFAGPVIGGGGGGAGVPAGGIYGGAQGVVGF